MYLTFMNDHRLARKLLRIVAIKLAILFALWWAFFRQQGVDVDAAKMASVIQQSTQGEKRHDQ